MKVTRLREETEEQMRLILLRGRNRQAGVALQAILVMALVVSIFGAMVH